MRNSRIFLSATLLSVTLAVASSAQQTATKADMDLAGCRSNLKFIGQAVDDYAAAHGGKFPPTLAALIPKYLSDKKFLICPSAKSDTYSATYNPKYVLSGGSTTYWFCCKGKAHMAAGAPVDHPTYDGIRGVQIR